jgi:hypothetical protein
LFIDCLQEKVEALLALGADVRQVPVVPFTDEMNYNHQVRMNYNHQVRMNYNHQVRMNDHEL